MAKQGKISHDEYEFIDRGEENFHHIKLVDKSPYKDVVFQFGEVKLLEEDGALRVKFEYEVFENPRFLDTKSDKFVNYIGEILITNLEELLFYNKFKREQSSGN